MTDENLLLKEFEAHRARLNSVAYRMLGSRAEADDAVQEAWLRLSRSSDGEIVNMGGWLTTVVARLCLDQLRARKARREEPLEDDRGDVVVLPSAAVAGDNPEERIEMADSVGLAMLAVLETLSPGERVAFVLHDVFAVPFDEIAPIVGRTPEAARQLASRARRRVRGARPEESADRGRRRQIVDAFIAASRGGDFGALLELLDPDVVLRGDEAAVRLGGHAELRGAAAVAGFFNGSAQAAWPARIDGRIDIAVMPAGRLLLVLRLDIAGGRIAAIETVADRSQVEQLTIEVLGG